MLTIHDKTCSTGGGKTLKEVDEKMKQKYEQILSELSKDGGRITKQRKQIISVILENPGSTCKEIYYIARTKNKKVGRATVYRTVSTLENLGYFSRQTITVK